MKTKCIYTDCQQKIEYPKEMAGQNHLCPTCSRMTFYPKASVWAKLLSITGSILWFLGTTLGQIIIVIVGTAIVMAIAVLAIVFYGWQLLSLGNLLLLICAICLIRLAFFKK